MMRQHHSCARLTAKGCHSRRCCIADDLEDEELIRRMADGRQRVIIPDVNLLVYAVHAESEQHAAARAGLDEVRTGDEPVGFSWTVLTGFIRVSTNPRVVAAPARFRGLRYKNPLR